MTYDLHLRVFFTEQLSIFHCCIDCSVKETLCSCFNASLVVSKSLGIWSEALCCDLVHYIRSDDVLIWLPYILFGSWLLISHLLYLSSDITEYRSHSHGNRHAAPKSNRHTTSILHGRLNPIDALAGTSRGDPNPIDALVGTSRGASKSFIIRCHTIEPLICSPIHSSRSNESNTLVWPGSTHSNIYSTCAACVECLYVHSPHSTSTEWYPAW